MIYFQVVSISEHINFFSSCSLLGKFFIIILLFFFCFQTCSGFVRGPPNTSPQLVTFQQDFKKGALLTIVSMAYQRGKIMVTIKILKAFAVMM